ncbi:MAG: EpsI family protein [Candidatus Zixiibacteriota bacterium]|jgi:EpsI family protein
MKRTVIIAIVLLIVAGIFGNYLRYVRKESDSLPAFSTIPLDTSGYTGTEHRFADYSYEVLQADTTTLRHYVDSEGDTYWLFVAYFRSQKYGSQIHSPKHCLPGGGWTIEHIEPYALPLPNGETQQVNRLVIDDRNKKQLMIYWFETRGGAIRNEFGLKFDLMRNSLLFRPTDAAIVRLTIPLKRGDSMESATKRAIKYFDEFYPSIEASLPFGNVPRQHAG